MFIIKSIIFFLAKVYRIIVVTIDRREDKDEPITSLVFKDLRFFGEKTAQLAHPPEGF